MAKALVFWVNDDKTSVEDISNVPEDCRFVGAVAQIMWTCNKRRYPGKVLMISDYVSEIEKFELKYQAERKQAEKKNQGKKSTRQRKAAPSVASGHEVDLAIDGKPRVPDKLKKLNSSISQKNKATKNAFQETQSSMETHLIESAKKSLFTSPLKRRKESVPVYNDGESGDEFLSSDEVLIPNSAQVCTNTWHNCTCEASQALKNFDNDSHRALLKCLLQLLSGPNKSLDTKLYLQLKSIPKDLPKVEITKGSGVYIPVSLKNKLKIDYGEQPKRMLMETLYLLYGHDKFKMLPVTARGNKAGTFCFEPHVLTAVIGFVNRNTADPNLRMSEAEFVKVINKRSNDVRSDKGSQSKASARSSPDRDLENSTPPPPRWRSKLPKNGKVRFPRLL